MKKLAVRKTAVKTLVNGRLLITAGFLVAGALLLCGAYCIGRYSVSRQLASGDMLEQARQDIVKQYLAASSTACTNPSDPIQPQARAAVFYQYLRVNRYADRAVIRGCNDTDTLLAKTARGWEQTSVNISLDLRANPAWQRACRITDITRADTVVRPENSSIDAFNLKECNYIATYNRVPTWDELMRL